MNAIAMGEGGPPPTPTGFYPSQARPPVVIDVPESDYVAVADDDDGSVIEELLEEEAPPVSRRVHGQLQVFGQYVQRLSGTNKKIT